MINKQTNTIAKQYNDRLYPILESIIEALDNKEITPEQAKQVIGLAIATDMKKIFKTQLKSLQPKSHNSSYRIMFLDYTKKLLQYG